MKFEIKVWFQFKKHKNWYLLFICSDDWQERKTVKWFCFLDKQSLHILNKLLYYVMFGQSTWFQERCNKMLLDSPRCRKNIYTRRWPGAHTISPLCAFVLFTARVFILEWDVNTHLWTHKWMFATLIPLWTMFDSTSNYMCYKSVLSGREIFARFFFRSLSAGKFKIWRIYMKMSLIISILTQLYICLGEFNRLQV